MTRRQKAKPLPRKDPELVLSRKLTLRLTEADCDRLTELRMALHTRSDGEALREIIQREHGRLAKAALRAARAARREAEERQAAASQLPMFRGAK